MKPTRVWQAILDGNRNIRFGDFERLLAAFGFRLDRQTGSHRIRYHPTLCQLVQLVEAAGLTLDD